MANNPIVNSLTFTGSVAGQATIQSQGIAGGLTFLLPNTAPVQGQLISVSAINGNNVFLGWASMQSSTIALTQLDTTGATTGDVIQFNGTSWAVSAFVPGSGTVTSVALTAPAEFSVGGSPITGSGTLAITKATQSANTVWAGPVSGGAAVPAFRALVSADIPDLSAVYLSVSTVLAQNRPAATHNFITAYDSGTGLFSIAQPSFTDISGTITVGTQISTQGIGSSVLSYDGGGSTPGHVIIFDGAGTTTDSGVLLSSLGTVSSVSGAGIATGTVTTTGSITVLGSGNDSGKTAATALTTGAGTIATAPAGSLVTTDGSGNVQANPSASINDVAFLDGTPTFSTPVTFSGAGTGLLVTTGVQAEFQGTLWVRNSLLITDNAPIHTGATADDITIDTSAGTGSVVLSTAGANPAIVVNTAGAIAFTPGTGQDVTAPTKNPGTADTSVATTAYSDAAVAALSSTIPHLVGNGANGSPGASDNHISNGNNTVLPGANSDTTGVTITLTGPAVYSAANAYSVQVSKIGTAMGGSVGVLFVNVLSGTQFTITSTDPADASAIYWTCFGKTAGD